MPDDEPLLTQLRHCSARRRYGVDDIGAVAQHVEVSVASFGPESGVVRCDHRITHQDILIETFPVVEQRLHQRGSASPGNAAGTMRPGEQPPTAFRGMTALSEHEAR